MPDVSSGRKQAVADALSQQSLPGMGTVFGQLHQAISPWNWISPADVASNLPGGGIPAAWDASGRARDALYAGDYGGAAREYGNVALSLLPEGTSMAAAFLPARRLGELPLQGGSVNVYHGTGRTYDAPQLGADQTTLGSLNDGAHYVTPRTDIANSYAETTGPYRQNQGDWSPQVRMYRMGDANTLAMTPDEYFATKRVAAGTATKDEKAAYHAMLQDAFGETPKDGESFTDFARRMGVDRVSSGGAVPEEIMVLDPSTLLPRFGN